MSPVIIEKIMNEIDFSIESFEVIGQWANRTLTNQQVQTHELMVRLPAKPQIVTYVTVASLKFRFPDTLILRKEPWTQSNVFHNLHINFQQILS